MTFRTKFVPKAVRLARSYSEMVNHTAWTEAKYLGLASDGWSDRHQRKAVALIGSTIDWEIAKVCVTDTPLTDFIFFLNNFFLKVFFSRVFFFRVRLAPYNFPPYIFVVFLAHAA